MIWKRTDVGLVVRVKMFTFFDVQVNKYEDSCLLTTANLLTCLEQVLQTRHYRGL